MGCFHKGNELTCILPWLYYYQLKVHWKECSELCNKVFLLSVYVCKKQWCVLLASSFLTLQTGYTLAVAEQVLEFEHRDLHWGNVLVSETTEKNVTFKLCGKEYTVPTQGVRVSTYSLRNRKCHIAVYDP